MRAMVYRGPYKIRVEEKDVPAIEHPNDAIVRVTLAAMEMADLFQRLDAADADGARGDDIDADRFGKPLSFLKPGFGRTAGAVPYPFGNDDDCAFAAGNLHRAIAVEILGQAPFSPSP